MIRKGKPTWAIYIILAILCISYVATWVVHQPIRMNGSTEKKVTISDSSFPPLAVPAFSMPLSMMRYELGLLPTILKRIRLRPG